MKQKKFTSFVGIQYLEKSLRQLQKEVKGVNLGVIFNEAQKRASRQLNMGLGISTGNAVHSNFQNEVALLTKVNNNQFPVLLFKSTNKLE